MRRADRIENRSPKQTRRPDPPRVYFRADQAILDAERDAAAEVIDMAIERYQHRFSRVERARVHARRALRQTFNPQPTNEKE